MLIILWRDAALGLFAYGDPTPFGTVLLVLLDDCVRLRLFDFFNILGSVFHEKEVRLKSAPARRMFLMMRPYGFWLYPGGIVSGKAGVLHSNGITDWQTVWFIFRSYRWCWPSS